tara:strand:+ start:9075 stop:10205 length:1131 start_codon:yes stop_codon:yes gene_type:complete
MPYTLFIRNQPIMPRKINIDMTALTNFITSTFGDEFGADAVRSAASEFGVSYPTIMKRLDQYKVGYGKWNLTMQEKLEQTYAAPAAAPAVVQSVVEDLVPAKVDTFVPFGNFTDVKKIISSKIFYPVFITGMSGNGKTFGVEQACATLGRELIRVNLTIETDEDDLIGGFRLVDGNTVWHNGPVIEALERGAILLLDEIDLASNKVMCLQSILEGKGVFLKKTGRYVKPAAGFNIIATANTKGKGSDDGRFIGTNVLNEAFLERFALTFEQDYPTVKTEQKILEGISLDLGLEDREFCEKLAQWADIIRKTFKDGGIDEVISTRRLVHIVNAYKIFGKRMKAIEVCVNRFDEETKTSFIELYDKLDASVGEETEEG